MKADKNKIISVGGLWSGVMEQQINLELIEIKMQLYLHQDGSKVNGIFTADFNNDDIPPDVKQGRRSLSATNVHGTIRGNRFLHFTASHPDPEVLSFGSIILELMPSGHLEGISLGHSLANNQLIFTTLRFEHSGRHDIHEIEHYLDVSARSKTPVVTFSAAGQWRGKAKKQIISNSIEMDLDMVMHMNLIQDEDRLSGDSTIEIDSTQPPVSTNLYKENQVQKMNLDGWLRANRFLHLNYNSTDDSVVQFGSTIFEVLNPSVHLSGMFVGYSPASTKLVIGTAHLDKRLTFDPA